MVAAWIGVGTKMLRRAKPSTIGSGIPRSENETASVSAAVVKAADKGIAPGWSRVE
jgi:hypothetical protein